MKTTAIRFAAIALLALGAFSRASDEYNPHIDPADFQATVDNPYLPLVPGTTFKYAEMIGKYTNENEVMVTHDTKTIMGVTCVVVRDVVRWGDKIHEDTYDWYAQDKKGNVWYFGEDTKEFQKDGTVSTHGSWEAGVNGALPGVIMWGTPAPGESYRQEYSHDALDMGQVVAVDETVTVPFGKFEGCVKTKEWSLRERGHEHKWYAKGIGFIRAEASDGEVEELISVTDPK